MTDSLSSRHAGVARADHRRILLVDDEPAVARGLAAWLDGSGWSATCTDSATGAMLAVRDGQFALAVIDYRLTGETDGIRLGLALHQSWGLRFVLLSGHLDTDVVVNAMKAGASDVIAKPITPQRFLSSVERAAADPSRSTAFPGRGLPGPVARERYGSVSSRWATLVLDAQRAAYDPRTVPLWGRAVGVGSGTIEETCRLCGVSAHQSRDLARVMRALTLSQLTNTALHDHLAIADERTLVRLLRRAGLRRDGGVCHLEMLLARQAFIPTSKPCLAELAHMARTRYGVHF